MTVGNPSFLLVYNHGIANSRIGFCIGLRPRGVQIHLKISHMTEQPDFQKHCIVRENDTPLATRGIISVAGGIPD